MKLSGVRLSVRPIIRLQTRRAAGLLLSAVPAGDIDRQLWPAGAEWQKRCSTTLSSKCEQCRVYS